MPECSKCRQAIRGETGIKCMGVCDKIYHVSVKCCGLDQYSSQILETNKFIRFVCDDCMQYIHNVDMVLRNIQEDVYKNKQHLVDYKQEFKACLRENESEIKKLLEAIEKRYEERLNKIITYQKSCEKNVDEAKKLFSKVTDFESNNKVLCQTIEENNDKVCKEIKKVISESNKKQSRITYAESVKSGALPEIKKGMPLILKPKERQAIEKTKEELNKVNPTNLKIIDVENRKNGTIVIHSENNVEREKIKYAIEDKITTGYEIKVPTPIEYKIKIIGVSFNHGEADIIEKIRKQNAHLSNSKIKFIGKYEVEKRGRTSFNIKLAVDSESYKKIMDEKKINLGWERCRVYDGTEVLQCMKCRGYNHIAKECKNQEICLRCHGEHRTKECKDDEVKKCINCAKINKKLSMGLDENHHTNDRECPVYQNKLNAKMRRLGPAP